MEKVESSIENCLGDLDSLRLGFDNVARKRVREQLGLDPLENALNVEEDELLMFLLYCSVLY